jgi:hypothetical protein
MRFLLIPLLITSLNASAASANNINKASVLNQNQTYNFASEEWIKKLKISGLIMGETIFSDDNAGNAGRFSKDKKKNYSTFCFPRASLYVDAEINPLTTAHLALNFAPNKMGSSCSACGFGRKNDELRMTKYGNLDESYVTFTDSIEPKYYARAGIQYLPYGNYQRNIIPATLTQLLTQTQSAGLTIGYIHESGVNIAVYSFSGKKKQDKPTTINNFGGQIQHQREDTNSTDQFSLGWTNNIANSVNYIVSTSETCCGKEKNPLNSGYKKAVPAISASYKRKQSSWDFAVQFTSALTGFNSNDIKWKTQGAKPSAALIDLGYNFNSFGEKQTRIGASVQASKESLNIKGNDFGSGLPKLRFQGDYTIEVQKNVEFGTHIFWDKDYAKKDKGTGKNATTLLLTMAVKLG